MISLRWNCTKSTQTPDYSFPDALAASRGSFRSTIYLFHDSLKIPPWHTCQRARALLSLALPAISSAFIAFFVESPGDTAHKYLRAPFSPFFFADKRKNEKCITGRSRGVHGASFLSPYLPPRGTITRVITWKRAGGTASALVDLQKRVSSELIRAPRPVVIDRSRSISPFRGKTRYRFSPGDRGMPDLSS